MLDNFDCFGDKLLDDSVFTAFLSVVGKLRRWAKPEGKVSGIGSLALLGSSLLSCVLWDSYLPASLASLQPFNQGDLRQDLSMSNSWSFLLLPSLF